MANTMIFPGNASMTERVSTNHNFETEDFTLHCWMNTIDSGPLFTQPATHLSVSVHPNGSLQFTVKFGDRLQVIQSDRTGFNDGNWHHVAAVRSGQELSLYVNGKALETTQRWANIEAAGSDGSEQQFIGSLGPTGIWDNALTKEQIRKTFIQSMKGNEPGLLSHHTFNEKHGALLSSLALLTVQITLTNQSNSTLEKQADKTKNPFYKQFPQKIEANDKVVINITNSMATWEAIHCDVVYENALGTVEVEVLKTRDMYNSSITATTGKDLIDELTTVSNTATGLTATLTVAESLVLAMMQNFYDFMSALRGKLKKDQIVTAGGNLAQLVDYNQACQIFNTYYELKPLAIVYCETTEDVQLVYTTAVANNLPVRVRSGGHDHEGECSGTDTIVLDMTRIDHVKLAKQGENGPVYAHIGPGIRFISLTTILAKQDVMIPHGTCATVGIAGFTMGGGWGPWTRKEGMCCEKLMGATIVLGDGSVQKLEITDGKVPELLWALRGGGGMSYGIVTELVIETFPLPAELIKFQIEWNPYSPTTVKEKGDKVGRKMLAMIEPKTTPTLNILKAWEKIILSKETPKLIGTNLQVSAKNWDQPTYDKFDVNTVFHNCIMYGYWQGDLKTLKEFLKVHYKSVPRFELTIDGEGGSKADYGTHLMSNWDRKSFTNVKRLLKGLGGKPFPPDLEAPSPHKITSRFVNHEGLSPAGYKALLESLTSPLISTENIGLGLFTYITLGALAGDFYHSMPEKQKKESAFPYKDKQYTIQYQTWWNEELAQKEEWQDNDVYKHTNRALDWMQQCRDFDIPHTSGAFISFKDSSIPTSVYFDSSYEKLMNIKKEHSKDPKNHFRTRKTIL